MAYDSYTLATIAVPAGTLTLTIGFDDSLPALTVPARTVMDISPFTERIDVEMNVIDLEAVTLVCSEDYSTYSDGFWFNAIEGYPDLDVRLTAVLNNGTVDLCMFSGTLMRSEVTWEELYIGSSFIRRVNLKFASNLLLLKNVSIADLLDEAVTHGVEEERVEVGGSTSVSHTFVKLRDIFASAIHLAFGETYSVESIILDPPDILIGQVTGATFPGQGFNPMEQYVILRLTTGGVWEGLGDVDNDISFYSLYANAYELIAGISKMFAYVPRLFYGNVDGSYTSAGKAHRIRLISRGRSSQSVSLTANILRSKLTSGIEFENIPSGVMHSYESRLDWYYDGELERSVILGNISDAEIAVLRPELMISFLFYVGEGATIDGAGYNVANVAAYQYSLYYNYDYGGAVGVGMIAHVDAAFYNHLTDAWVTYTHGDYAQGDSLNFLAIALSQYLRNRYTPNRKRYDRQYSTVQAVLSADGINIISNPSFEEVDLTAGVWDSGAWYWDDASFGTASIALIDTDSNTGYRCVAMTGVDGDNAAGISETITGDENNTYTISLFAKLVGAGSPTLSVYWDGDLIEEFTPTTSWVEYSVESTGRSGVFRIANYTNTQINVDDVSVKLKSGSTIPKVVILDSATIDDGVESTQYYATEIENDIAGNTTRVVWMEE